jgi:DNA-binding XRE family transcriptional regulator
MHGMSPHGDIVIVRSARDLGAVVRDARLRRGWTQAELANRIDVSRQWVIALEQGKATAELGTALAVHMGGQIVGTMDAPDRRSIRFTYDPDYAAGPASTPLSVSPTQRAGGASPPTNGGSRTRSETRSPAGQPPEPEVSDERNPPLPCRRASCVLCGAMRRFNDAILVPWKLASGNSAII